MATPSSRLIFNFLPWYSFLIVIGAALAIFLASREEKRTGLPKDTIIDLSLLLLPFGILGARLYYVLFAWHEFSHNLLSVFKIWEGGLAIYGGIIAGLLVVLVFSRRRKLSFFHLCDCIAPGLALAQAIGRWGNYFNCEAYGALVENPALQFFPFAVLIPMDPAPEWHLATFFYESVWNFGIFLFLLVFRRKMARKKGDVFLFYAFLYACGRLVIEDLRMDSLYAIPGLRVSQLLSVLACAGIMIFYVLSAQRNKTLSLPKKILLSLHLALSLFVLLFVLNLILPGLLSIPQRILLLSAYSLFSIVILFIIFGFRKVPLKDENAEKGKPDNQSC